MIVLQLKSAHRKSDLDSIASIINEIDKTRGFRIRGLEMQELAPIMSQMSMNDRAEMVADFCIQNNIEYLTYHAPIFLNGENFWDDRWKSEMKKSILLTVEEAEIVYSKAALQNKIIVVTHLTNHLLKTQLPLSRQDTEKMHKDTESEFMDLYSRDLLGHSNSCHIAAENSLPVTHGEYSNIGLFHPSQTARLGEHGIGAVFDFAHYHIYSNYMKSTKEIYWDDSYTKADNDRTRSAPPDWTEAIRILSGNLFQLHINDAKGSDAEGESLPLGEGEIPIIDVLTAINSTIKRTIQGTVEIKTGHLNNSIQQLEGARWLLDKLPDGVFA